MLFNEVCTNIHVTLIIWKFWTLGKYCCPVKNVYSILVDSTKSESSLYQDSKCCSCHLISWVRLLKRLLEIAGSFISAKLRVSLRCVSVKIMILWNGKIPLNLRWRKVYWQCAHELRVAHVGMICAFSYLQVNTGRQKLCCYCLCRVVTDAEISLISRS